MAQAQLETALAAQESQRRVLDTLNAQLAARVAELAGIHREVATALQTWTGFIYSMTKTCKILIIKKRLGGCF